MRGTAAPNRLELIELLAAYRRPGTPVFAYHYRRLPADVLNAENAENADILLGILADEELPAVVRDHAAGALGQMGCRQAIPALIDALRSSKTRRGAATALGILKSAEARDALARLAASLGVAKWAHEQVSTPGSVGGIIASLRDGHLHRIRLAIATLDGRVKAEVATTLVRMLREQVSNGHLASSDRWMVTSLRFLAPMEATRVIVDALRLSIGVKDCCGCLCKRTTWAAAAIGSPEAIPALVDMIAKSHRPQNVQQAAVCIEKIVGAHPDASSEVLGKEERRLSSALRRIRKKAAATPRRPPRMPWDGAEGTPRWVATSMRAEKAVERVVRLEKASCDAPASLRAGPRRGRPGKSKTRLPEPSVAADA